MALPYTPTVFTRRGATTVATDWEEHHQLLFDGWRPEGTPPSVDRRFDPVVREELANFRTDEDVKDFRESLVDFVADLVSDDAAGPLLSRLTAAVTDAEAFRDETSAISGLEDVEGAMDLSLPAKIANSADPVGAALNNAIGTGARDVLQFHPCAHVSTTAAGSDPVPMDSIGGWLYGRVGSALYRAVSEAGPWTAIHTFSGTRLTAIREAGDGEVIVAESGKGIWRSTGWAANQLTATWTLALDTTSSDNVIEQFCVNVDPRSGWVGVTTYGANVADMSGSRYLWLSTDGGKAGTFNVVYDKTIAHPEVNAALSHMHHISFDPYWDGTSGHRPNGDATTPRLWAVWHKTSADPTVTSDPKNFVIYSDNAGSSWTEYTTADHHGVIAIATPAGMVMDTDFTPVSLWLIPRGATVAAMPRRMLYRRRPAVATDNTAWGWAAKAIRGAGDAVHVLFRSSAAGHPAGVVSTDGLTAEETLTITAASGADSVDGVGFTRHAGRLLASVIQTNTAPSAVQVVAADEPARGAATPQDNGIAGGVAEDASVAVGRGATATNVRGAAVGHAATAARDAVAIGQAATAGVLSTAIGAQASSTGGNGVAIGKGASSAGGSDATVVGTTASAASRSTVVGFAAAAIGTDAVTVGWTAKGGTSSVSIGRESGWGTDAAYGGGSEYVAVGYRTKTASNATAVGSQAVAIGARGTALGKSATVNHDDSVAVGNSVTTTAAFQVAVGPRHFDLQEVASAPAGAADRARLYVADNGSGKTGLYVKFADGTAQQLAIQP